MDFLYYTVYYVAILFTPITLYFLIFKKRNSDGFYEEADWFYPVRYFVAANEVKKYVNKSKNIVEKLYATLETEINISSVEEATSQTFFGLDQTGNSLSLSVTIGINQITELRLCLRLADGNVYVFPDNGYVYITNLAKKRWKVKGLSIDVLEPYRRLRIIFNGLLKNIGADRNDEIEHIQFHFIFTSAASPVFVPQDLDRNLLISSLSGDSWKDSSWKNNLIDQLGFYQFGALKGFLKGNSYVTEKILNLSTCRSRLCGRDERQILNRSLTLLIADEYGNLINLILRSLRDGHSQLNYGTVFLSTNRSLQLRGSDIKLKDIGKHKSFPDKFIINIRTSGKDFKCVIDIAKRKQVEFVNGSQYTGYECYNFPGQCGVNSTVGKAIIEFSYHRKGDEIFIPEHRVCELSIEILPKVLVTDIKSEEAQILQLTGGKGNSLALLSSIDSKEFEVPEGFIVTVNAFKLQITSNTSIKNSIQNLNDIYCQKCDGNPEEASNETVTLLKNTNLLPEIIHSIKNYFEKYNNEETQGWAVRSSAIGEDSEELSAAGQNETFLGCKTFEQILKSVAACWASLFKTQSVVYRWQHGLSIMADMAVVVQKIVPADSAGVLFTCHPTSSDPAEIVISSNFGIGETVVSGDIDPDTCILRRSWDNRISIFEKLRGTKGKKLVLKDHRLEEISNNMEEFSLNDKQLLHLAKVGLFIEDVFGNPRDIEWAFHKDRLYLLQSRPITTLYAWSDFEITHEMDFPVLTDQSVFTVANVREVMPNALTVLSQTSSVLAVDRSLQNYAQQNYDPLSSKGICLFQHSTFIDTVSSLHQNVTEDIKTDSLILDLSIFGHPVLDEKINRITLNRNGGPTSGLRKLIRSLRVIKAAWQNSQIVERAKNLVENLTFELNQDVCLEEMVIRINDQIDNLTEISLCHGKTTSASVFYQVVAINILLEGGNDITPNHYADFALILSSCEDVISAEVPLYLEKIAALIRDHFDADTFCKLNESSGVEWINKHSLLKDIFSDFLGKHGHRSLHEFEIMEKSWREDQTRLIPMIQANVKYGKISEKKYQTVEDIIKNLITPKKSSTRKIIKFLIKKMRTAVSIREQSKSELIRAVDKFRQAYRVLAKKMVTEGFIPREELIYHLTQYEIRELITNRNTYLVAKALRREKLYPTWCNYKYPEISFGAPVPENFENSNLKYNTVNCVTGTPVCSGSVKARACVIDSLKEIHHLQKGDVLITYSTDIGWSPYFPMISGIVTELGGLVSHGAVVAREYGLPSIVGVRNVTKYFKTGELVLLNGDKGELGKILE